MLKLIIAQMIRIMYRLKEMIGKLLSIFHINIIYYKFLALPKKYKILITSLFAALFILYKFLFPAPYPEDIKMVEVHKVAKTDMLHTTRLLGTIKAKKYYTVTAGYSGTMQYIAENGSTLKKGENLAQIDNAAFEDAYQSSLEAAKIAEEQYQREQKLFKNKTSSKQAMEDKYTNLANARRALASAKADIDKVLFTSPFDGIVGSPLVHVGSRVNPGDAILTFYDPAELVVEFDIPSTLAPSINKDSVVTINNTEHKLGFVQKAVSAGTYTVPAYVDFKCKDCLVGEMVDVDLHIANKKDIIAVPSSCVFIFKKKNAVYKIKNAQAELAFVEVGIRQKNIVEIIDGISEGDIIVLDGVGRLYPTAKVKIHDATD